MALTRKADATRETENTQIEQATGPQAAYAETMNCRCTLTASIKGFERDLSDLTQRWSRLPEGMAYEQWKAEGLREKKTLSRGRVSYTQEELDEVIERNGIDFNLPVKPTVNPRLRTPGATRYTQVFPGYNKVTAIEIGPQKNGDEKELVDTILHESIEAKLIERNDARLAGGDAEVHPYIERVIEKYVKMKGLW